MEKFMCLRVGWCGSKEAGGTYSSPAMCQTMNKSIQWTLLAYQCGYLTCTLSIILSSLNDVHLEFRGKCNYQEHKFVLFVFLWTLNIPVNELFLKDVKIDINSN